MENSPLNQAHQLERRAERRARAGRYTEAVNCHERAAALLLQLLAKPLAPRALQSVQLQVSHHVRQRDLLNLKLISQRDHHTRGQRSSNMPPPLSLNKPNDSLKIAVDKTIGEADSLITILKQRIDNGESESYECIDVDTHKGLLETSYKNSKSEAVIIEELRVVVDYLRKNIVQLYSQLDLVESENEELKLKLQKYEGDDNDTTNPSNSPSSPVMIKQHMAHVERSNNDFVLAYSPPAYRSERVYEELEDLPPLEMPDFNYGEKMKELASKQQKEYDERK